MADSDRLAQKVFRKRYKLKITNRNIDMDAEKDDYISVYEYEKNVNPHLDNVPFFEKGVSECDYGIHLVDFSDIFHVSHRATTPNLLASFIKVASA